MSYVEYLLCHLLIASGIVASVLYIIGSLIAWLIDHHWEI